MFYFFRPLSGRLLQTLYTLFLLFTVGHLFAQPSLIDSIEQRLLVETDADERIDLLLGLCQASIFAQGAEQSLPIIARAHEQALATADSAGLGRVLLFLPKTGYSPETGISKEAQAAFDISKSIGDRNLEIIVIRHLVSSFLYDKYDLVNAQKWLSYGHNRLTPSINPKHRGNLYKVAALYHETLGNQDSMDYWLAAALTEFQQVGQFKDPKLGRVPSENWDNGALNRAVVLGFQGNSAATRGDFELSQQKFAEAIAVSRDWQANNVLRGALTDFGIMQSDLGDIKGAIASLSEAMKIHKAHKDMVNASNTAQRIGHLFLLVKDGKAASRFYQLAREDATSISDTIEMSNSLLGLAWSSQMIGDLPTAIQFLNSAITLAKQSKDTITQSFLQSERARQAFNLGQVEDAKLAFKEAIQLHLRYQHESYIQAGYIGLARCYLALNQLDSALAIMPRAEEVVLRVGGLHKQRETAELYAKIAEAAEDLPLAVLQHKRIQAVNDSLNKQNGQLDLRREEVRQNVDDFRAENEALERERELLAQRNKLYLALTAALLLLLGIGGYLLFRLRAARQALSATNDQLRGLNATKDRFFGIIAHDLRSPIISLDSVGEQLRFYLDRGRTNKATDLADNIGNTASRLSRLLDQLLNWALLQQGTMPHHPERLPLAEVVEEVVELFGPAATIKGVTLDCKVPNGVFLLADPAGLRTMLRNLVSNAIKFTPNGGLVTVSSTAAANGTMVLEVQDDGIGMAADRVNTLLQREGKTKSGTDGERGSGLGLRLVKDLAQLHAADITVTSKSGVGSCFRLIFPT